MEKTNSSDGSFKNNAHINEITADKAGIINLQSIDNCTSSDNGFSNCSLSNNVTISNVTATNQGVITMQSIHTTSNSTNTTIINQQGSNSTNIANNGILCAIPDCLNNANNDFICLDT